MQDFYQSSILLLDSSEINHSTNDIDEYDYETKQRFLKTNVDLEIAKYDKFRILLTGKIQHKRRMQCFIPQGRH